MALTATATPRYVRETAGIIPCLIRILPFGTCIVMAPVFKQTLYATLKCPKKDCLLLRTPLIAPIYSMISNTQRRSTPYLVCQPYTIS
jgi:hypothetical protein